MKNELIRNPDVFFEPLRKRQIEELATIEVKQMIEAGNLDPLRTHVFYKRLKTFVDKWLSENEAFAIDQFNQDKIKNIDNADISFSQGGEILDYEKDPEYKALKEALKKREDHLKMAFKMNEQLVIDGEIIPKVPVKNYRKDSLNIRL